VVVVRGDFVTPNPFLWAVGEKGQGRSA
jgi:hypothetical protein